MDVDRPAGDGEVADGDGSTAVLDAAAPPADVTRTRRRALQGAVFAVPAIWMAAVGWAHRGMTEDGFIYLRVAEQLGAGNGPVFNTGERVEAATGTLWVALLAVGDLVAPIRLEWLSVLLGLGCSVGAVVLAMLGGRRLRRGLDDDGVVYVPLGVLAFVALYVVWAYATSGLETGLVFAWLGGCFWILADWAQRPDARMSVPRAVVLGAGWLVRPELILFSAAFVLLVVIAGWSTDRPVDRLRFVAAAVALPLVYQVFRMGYYGSLVPNTAIAKEGGRSLWDRGWRYLQDFAGPYWLWVPALGLVAGGYVPLARVLRGAADRRRSAVVVTFVAGGLLNALYVMSVGGDYHHGRMFLPALFALVLPVAVVPATRSHALGLVVVAWALVAALWLRPDQITSGNWLANGFLAPRDFGVVTAEDVGWSPDGPRMAWLKGDDLYLQTGAIRYVPPGVEPATELDLPYLAAWGVGVSAYGLGPDVDVLDQLGLADAFTSHLDISTQEVERYPGHEKPLPTVWLAARITQDGSRPDPDELPSLFPLQLIPTTEGDAFQVQVAWARAALRCEPIEDLLASARAPLTPGRFVRNLWGSLDNTRLRIPPDPKEAYRRFCGEGTPPEVQAVHDELAAGG